MLVSFPRMVLKRCLCSLRVFRKCLMLMRKIHISSVLASLILRRMKFLEGKRWWYFFQVVHCSSVKGCGVVVRWGPGSVFLKQ